MDNDMKQMDAADLTIGITGSRSSCILIDPTIDQELVTTPEYI